MAQMRQDIDGHCVSPQTDRVRLHCGRRRDGEMDPFGPLQHLARLSLKPPPAEESTPHQKLLGCIHTLSCSEVSYVSDSPQI